MALTSKIALHMSKAPLFASVEAMSMEKLVAACKLQEYARGVEVVQKQKIYEGCYFIYKGCIKLYFLSKSGKEESAGYIKNGSTFGEVNLFMKDPLPVYGRTTMKTTLVFIPRAAMLDLLGRSPIVAMQMMVLLSQKLYSMTQELELVSTLSAHERVMHFIVTELTKNIPGNSNVNIKDTKAEVASSLHLTPETFSRVIHNLEEDGVISVQGKKIQVHDKHKLGMN